MSEIKIKETVTNETFEIDKNEVIKDLKEKGIYEKDSIKIKNYQNTPNETKLDDKSYLIDISTENTNYKGILNNEFIRSSYGINKYSNGDIYLGEFNKDKKNGNGVYIYNPGTINENIKTEVYIGNWKDDEKEGSGIYFWMDELEGNKSFDDANFEAFIGDFNNNKFVKGAYLTKEEDSYYLYFGKINEDGKKNDEDAFFYSSNLDRLFKGNIIDDVYQKGYISFFNFETGILEDIKYFEFEGKDKIKKIVKKEKIDKDKFKNLENSFVSFRNIILDKDYFGLLYEKYKNVEKLIKSNIIKNYENFGEKENIKKIEDICNSYLVDNITTDITYNIK